MTESKKVLMADLTTSRPASLHRYTSIQNAVQMLETRALTLRSPAYWEDRNDAFALELYARRIRAKSVLACCFTQASETYHHWKVFAKDGVCIEFSKERFLHAFDRIADVKLGTVQYREIRKLAKAPPRVEQLPFLKRYPYRDENEFRIVYSGREVLEERSFAFPLSSVRRITLSPWLPVEQVAREKVAIKRIAGCARLPVYRSTVLDNRDWKKALSASRG